MPADPASAPHQPEPRPGEGSGILRPEDSNDLSTQDLIVEARRPLLVERHRRMVEEMEASLAENWINGQTDHPRLKAMLAELDLDSEQQRLRRTLGLLGDDRHRGRTLRAAVVEELCILREDAGIEIAALQLHLIGVYRALRVNLARHQGEPPSLAELRELPAARIAALLTPIAAGFGDPRLVDAVVSTPAFAERTLRFFARIRRNDEADTHWSEVGGDPPLPREVEEPLRALPDSELKATRLLLIRDRIRSRFFRSIFLTYLSADELDPHETTAHPTVLHWLQAIESTAHLYPFMQGQTAGQKAFRLGQLAQKLVQMHELYARVAQASVHATYRDRFAGKTVKERLAVLAADRYPPLAATDELTVATLLCPFDQFVTFVQTQVGARDFVLPPDPRR